MKTACNLEGLISWEDHQFRRERIAPGVMRHGCHWGVIFEGKRDALIAAGVAVDGWFSDCQSRNKRGFIIRQKRFIQDGREIKTGVSAQGRCRVDFIYTERERDAALCAHKLAMHRQHAFKNENGFYWALFDARQDQAFQGFMHGLLG